MSGICGGHLGGQRDLTDAQDAMYQRQIDRIRKEEAQPVEPVRSPHRKRGDKATQVDSSAGDVIDLMDLLQQSLAKSKRRGRRPRTQAIAKADKADE